VHHFRRLSREECFTSGRFARGDVDINQERNVRDVLHGKNGFAEVSKNLARYGSEVNLLDYQNNYVGYSSWLLKCQHFLRHCSFIIFEFLT